MVRPRRAARTSAWRHVRQREKPPVDELDCQRRPALSALGAATGAVPADHLDTGLGVQPGWRPNRPTGPATDRSDGGSPRQPAPFRTPLRGARRNHRSPPPAASTAAGLPGTDQTQQGRRPAAAARRPASRSPARPHSATTIFRSASRGPTLRRPCRTVSPLTCLTTPVERGSLRLNHAVSAGQRYCSLSIYVVRFASGRTVRACLVRASCVRHGALTRSVATHSPAALRRGTIAAAPSADALAS